MQFFSIQFLVILAIALVIITYRIKRKQKGSAIIQGKQISIIGEKMATEIGTATPLPCLMDEGKIFGADFKEKIPPSLPHTVNCTCQLSSVFHRSHDWFFEKNKEEPSKSDLGLLDRTDFRFYKYLLISNHPDADERTKNEYQELATGIAVAPDFKAKTLEHIHSALEAYPVRKTESNH